jgi:ATP-dependent helicase/nuclease subunit A
MAMSRKDATDPHFSAYVDASAGSGKTKLLVDRIIRILLSGVSPSKILAITFTNAAADEMCERLSVKLISFMTMTQETLENELCELQGSKVSQSIVKMARSLFMRFISESPKIQTLHGFCAKLLQKIQILNLNDQFISDSATIIDEDEKINLLGESFNEIISESNRDIEISWALNIALKHYDIEYIFELLCEFSKEISIKSNINQYEILNIASIKARVYQLYSIGNSITAKDIINQYVNSCDKKLLLEVSEIMATDSNVTSKVASNIIKEFLGLSSEDNFFHYVKTLLTDDLQPRKRLPLSSAMCKKHPEIEQFLIEQQKILCEVVDKIHSVSSAMLNCGLNILTWSTIKKFNEKKKKQMLFEYSDLIKDTTAIISDSDEKMGLLYSIDMNIEHLLVDEAQDLSEMQWFLIKTITDEFFDGIGTTTKIRTIFIVGDFKQAIFGFQGSAPWVFQEIKEYFRVKVLSGEQKWAEIDLNICYRCPPEILNVVDKLCNSVKASFNLTDNNSIEHRSVHTFGNGTIKCHEVESNNELRDIAKLTWQIPEGEQFKNDSSYELNIGQTIASTIYSWLNSQGEEKILPQDIMILLRKRSKLQDYLVESLRAYDIPITNLAAKNLSHSIYIYDLMAVLQFTIQPLDDMNVVALLKSHPFNYSENQIIELSKVKNTSLYDQIKDMEIINEIVFQSKVMDLKQFFEWYLDSIYCIKNNDTILFKNYIYNYYQATNQLKISKKHFILWLQDLLSQKQQKLYDNQSVRITTVHSAKGLEAPIVILADSYMSDKISSVKFAYEKDIFVLSVRSSTNNIKSLIEAREIQLKMEDMRLLYVAMTRAKKELHLFGRCNSKYSWYSMVKEAI